MQKGIVMLTEGRSGSSWLGTLINSTKVLGHSSEWVDQKNLGISAKHTTCEAYVQSIIDAASSENGFFSMKLFPRHLQWFQIQYGIDLLLYLNSKYDVKFVTLQREDKILQAISFAKSLQTKSWSSLQQKKGRAEYDFAQICRCYFIVNRSDQFWDDYLKLRGFEFEPFIYEKLLPTGAPFVKFVADHAGIHDLPPPESDLSVQRGQTTEIWKARFQSEALTAEFISSTMPSEPPRRNLSNLRRFFGKRHMKPGPYGY